MFFNAVNAQTHEYFPLNGLIWIWNRRVRIENDFGVPRKIVFILKIDIFYIAHTLFALQM